MTTKWNSLLVTAALTLSAAAAYGQDRVIAHIPFEFTTIAGVQPAGEYAVSRQGEATKLTNLANRNSSYLGIGVPEDAASRYQAAQLVFICGSESGCALTGVRLDNGHSWSYRAPRLKPSEDRQVAVIYLERPQAE